MVRQLGKQQLEDDGSLPNRIVSLPNFTHATATEPHFQSEAPEFRPRLRERDRLSGEARRQTNARARHGHTPARFNFG
ncbi:MAG: hypothetical protein AABP62_11115 [Planctomycetota bacterium]